MNQRPRFGRLRLTAHLLLASCLLASASCSPGDDGSGEAPLPPKPAVLRVNMSDYNFVVPVRAPAGRVVFDVTNAGKAPHRLSLFRLADGAPPLEDQLRASPQPAEPPLQNMAALAPGANSTFAVDLVPGARYAIASLWVGATGVTDASRGMVSEFVAGGRTGSRPPAGAGGPS
jgi:hypothetical protein